MSLFEERLSIPEDYCNKCHTSFTFGFEWCGCFEGKGHSEPANIQQIVLGKSIGPSPLFWEIVEIINKDYGGITIPKKWRNNGNSQTN